MCAYIFLIVFGRKKIMTMEKVKLIRARGASKKVSDATARVFVSVRRPWCASIVRPKGLSCLTKKCLAV